MRIILFLIILGISIPLRSDPIASIRIVDVVLKQDSSAFFTLEVLNASDKIIMVDPRVGAKQFHADRSYSPMATLLGSDVYKLIVYMELPSNSEERMWTEEGPVPNPVKILPQSKSLFHADMPSEFISSLMPMANSKVHLYLSLSKKEGNNFLESVAHSSGYALSQIGKTSLKLDPSQDFLIQEHSISNGTNK